MKSKQMIGIVLILAAMLLACSAEQVAEQEQVVISVKASVVERSTTNLNKSFTGSLEGEKQAAIYAKLAESVDRVLVKEGDRVTANQVLLSLDKYGPSSRYTETESLYRNAEKNFEKMSYLFKEGAISETQFDASKTEYEVNKASFEAVSRTVDVQTPIAGVVTSINVSEGEFANVGQQLATVATTGKLRVKFGVNADEIGFFSVGSDIIVSSESVGRQTAGKVVSIASSADPSTRAFEVEGMIDNGDGTFKPGMFVNIAFILERLEDVILIPQRAVLTLDDKPTVFVVNGGLSEKRIVSLGTDLTGSVVVTDGLTVGDTLVTLGQDFLEDSMPVNITDLNGQTL